MNALLLTVLSLGGADLAAMHGGGDQGGYCDPCAEGDGGGGHGHGHHKGGHGGWLGPMPQSCYFPSFGCYPSTRFMHRYPAFHGTYYRKSYNYRNYFDYPWHAGLHEPTSHFSYHVPGEAPGAVVPPQPVPEAASAPSSIRRASANSSTSSVLSTMPYKIQR